ncbi:MAG: DUF3833 domain-containing protein [Cellvibrionaceae bacterium]
MVVRFFLTKAYSAFLCFILLVSFLFVLSGCSSVDVKGYEDYQPRLIPESFFTGDLTAHGVVKNRSGKVIRMFNATIKASWKDGVGTLDEDFIFDDGEKQKRVWTLFPASKNSYAATAGDVVGVGSAKLGGNSLFLQYVLRVPYNDSTIDLSIDDRMYLVDKNTLINESGMYKFGVRVGTILLVIKK